MKWDVRTYFKVRALLCLFLVLAGFGLVAARAYKLQVLDRNKSLALAEHQYFDKKIMLTPHRGTIYDCRGKEFAVSIPVKSVYAQPALIESKSEVATHLANILGLNTREVQDTLTTSKSFVWVKRKISPDQYTQIARLRIKGIGFIPESKRFYPNSEIGAHLVGFAGVDSQGLEGLERIYDRYLKATDTVMMLERDALGRWIHIPASETTSASPHSIHLTIDLRIQYAVERELTKGISQAGAHGGVAIVMEPFTGKILALAVRPTFNPNLFGHYKSDAWRNRAITDPFEPGSLLKVFLAAASKNRWQKRTISTIYCENGSYHMRGATIHDMKPYGWLSLRNVIKVSSNIGASKLGDQLGAERFHHHLAALGFNEKTGINLIGEARGILRPASTWRKVDLATISFGQGLSVTALQMVTALSCIANGGTLMKPYIVERITDARNQVVEEFYPTLRRHALSKETCRRVTSLMEGVVSHGGTGALAALPGYSVAGKTGTSQKADLEKGGYTSDKIMTSFMGFVPSQHPRIAVIVILDEPVPSAVGGLSAAPIFRALAEELMSYMGVPREDRTPTTLVEREKYGQGHRRQGKIPRSVEDAHMPDLRGLGMRPALVLLQNRKVRIQLAGSGLLVDQRPAPGTPLQEGEEVMLTFAPNR